MSKTVGPYRLYPRGDYNPAADPLYSLLDLVSDGGGSFVYINDTPSNEPTSSTSHWQQIATMGGQDLADAAVAARDAAVAARDAAQGYKDDAAASAASAAKIGQNLLHNADFRNPVNQRVVVDHWGVVGNYFYDRWIEQSTLVLVDVGSSVILTPAQGENNAKIEQRTEYDLSGKTVCVTIYDTNTSSYMSCVISVPLTDANTVGQFSPNADSLYAFIIHVNGRSALLIQNASPTQEYKITKVKLELGTVSTLHLDPPMDHAVELPKCQRFFQVRSTNNVSAVDLRPSMRIAPTITGSGPYQYSADL